LYHSLIAPVAERRGAGEADRDGGADRLTEALRAISEQTSDVAATARAITDDRRSPKGTVRGLGKEEEDLVMLARGCDLHYVVAWGRTSSRP